MMGKSEEKFLDENEAAGSRNDGQRR